MIEAMKANKPSSFRSGCLLSTLREMHLAVDDL